MSDNPNPPQPDQAVAHVQGQFNAGQTLSINGTVVAMKGAKIGVTADGRITLTGDFTISTDQELDFDFVEAQATPPSTQIPTPTMASTLPPANPLAANGDATPKTGTTTANPDANSTSLPDPVVTVSG